MSLKIKTPDKSFRKLSFTEAANQDKKIIQFKKMVKRGTFNIDVTAYMNEVDQLHTARLIRKVRASDVLRNFHTTFIEAALQNQANRSRCVDILKYCYKAQGLLNILMDELRKHLKVSYREKLSEYRTIGERDSAIENVLARGVRKAQELQDLVYYVDLVVTDLDKCSWALSSIKDAMAIGSENKAARF